MAHVGAENAAASGTAAAAAGRKSPRLGAVGAGGLTTGLTARGPQDITNIAGSRNLQAVGKTKQAICESHVPTPAGYLVRGNATEIMNQLFQEEATFLPRPSYMESQTDINSKMRAILIDWLVEVHMKYRLRPETLFLTASLIDRYLSLMPVMRRQLQLVGVVALFIAAKFEEISPPELHDYVYITDKAFTEEDILVMECTMLTTLGFQIAVPTASHFLDRLVGVNQCDGAHRELAQYLVEMSLLDIRMLQYTPSHLVSAALLLSNELMGRPVRWPAAMVQQSRQGELALRHCSEELRVLLEQAPQNSLQAVSKKFSFPQDHCVAKMKFNNP